MALESISTAEAVIQSNDDNDLEDGEIPSDEDDEPIIIEPAKTAPEPPKTSPPKKSEELKEKSSDNKSSRSKKSGSEERLSRQKGASSDDWAGDVEKAIKAALDEDKSKSHDSKSKSSGSKSSSKSRHRKRSRDDKEEEHSRDQKKKKLSDEENVNEDDDEMLFVRGASPTRKGSHSVSPPPRRADQDSYNSGSDYDERSNRHRDDKRGGAKWGSSKHQTDRNKKAPVSSNRRGTTKDRLGSGVSSSSSSNKSRSTARSDRTGRRNQVQEQDPDAICVYYMQGKCHRDDCPYSHNALPPRKMELCKFYLMDCCAKRDKCLYMHHDFPCKFFHTGMKCNAGEKCKFSHEPMSEQVKNILLKHLETAPKEILGNFPRLTRDNAIYMINNTEKLLPHVHETQNAKIPSLFDVKIATPNEPINDINKDDSDDRDKNSNTHKDRKAHNKKTRWGSDEDRVPLDFLVKATQLGLQMTNQDKPANFYVESVLNEQGKLKEDSKDEKNKLANTIMSKDVDLRQLLNIASAPVQNTTTQVLSLAEQAARYAKSKLEEESDREEDSSLVIEIPDDENANKSRETVSDKSNEIPSSLPKHTQELYMRIQQQQREASDSYKNLENTNNQELSQENWYSDDDEDDDDENQLTIVLNNIQKEDEEEEKEKEKQEEDAQRPPSPPQPAKIPEPAAIVDKLGDLSKIDISMEVSKLLSSIKAQSNSKQEQSAKTKQIEEKQQAESAVTAAIDPRLSPNSRLAAQSNISRDPRMSRDPRQRRDTEQRTPALTPAATTASNVVKPSVPVESKDSKTLTTETSIYSLGIIAEETSDTDLRGARLDHDHRRKDMDLRCFPGGPSFGDTDLRLVGGYQVEGATKSGDVDLRHMLTLPFKPVPSHVPCTEIDASITSHPPIPFKVHVIDIPRPDYTGLKLTRHDPQVKYDPRLRKIFRLSKDDIVESPMSPPPMKMLDTPKSPPPVRIDPRRKALEAHPPPKIIPTTVQQHPIQEHTNITGIGMNMQSQYLQGSNNINQIMQPMGPPSLMMQPQNAMMNSMPPLMRDAPIMNAPNMGMNDRIGDCMVDRMNDRVDRMNDHMIDRMSGRGMDRMVDRFDPRFGNQRGTSVGLLGVAPPPQQLSGYQDPRSQFDGPPRGYANDNYVENRGFGNNERSMGFNEPQEWNNGRPNRKDRRRTVRGKFNSANRKKDI